MQKKHSNYQTPSYHNHPHDSDTSIYHPEEPNNFSFLTKVYEEQEKRQLLRPKDINLIDNSKLKDERENRDRAHGEGKKRRSRNDQEGRNHRCECGKTYLSNTALYTHRKQKHPGKELSGTTKNNSHSPKRVSKTHQGQGSLGSNENQQQCPTKVQLPKVLTEGVNKESLAVFEQYLEVVKGKVSAEQSITFPKFSDKVSKIQGQPTKEISANTSIDEVLAVYIYNMAQYCNARFFKFLQDTLVCLRSCVNQNYKTALKSHILNSQIYTMEITCEPPSQGLQYCEVCSCEYLPLFSSYFVLHYAPKHMNQVDQKLMGYMIQDLCRWLSEKKLTRLKLSRREENSSKVQN